MIQLSDRLEDQAYFHGRIPRSQSVQLLTEKGDYLLRMNDQGKVVLSILWTDPVDSQKLKDGHYYIYEKDGVSHSNCSHVRRTLVLVLQLYYFQTESIGQPTISKLIIHYARQRLELRNDGTHLIRPVEKPDYIINNDEIRLHESIGGVSVPISQRTGYRAVRSRALPGPFRCGQPRRVPNGSRCRQGASAGDGRAQSERSRELRQRSAVLETLQAQAHRELHRHRCLPRAVDARHGARRK